MTATALVPDVCEANMIIKWKEKDGRPGEKEGSSRWKATEQYRAAESHGLPQVNDWNGSAVTYLLPLICT
jgi:hypothetical protein